MALRQVPGRQNILLSISQDCRRDPQGAFLKSLILTVDVQLPDNPGRTLRVAGCPECGARFYDSQVPPDYAEPGLNNRGRVPYARHGRTADEPAAAK